MSGSIVIAEPSRLLTRTETAERFGVSETKLDSLVAEGIAPRPVRLGQRGVRWHSTKVTEAIDRLAGILPAGAGFFDLEGVEE